MSLLNQPVRFFYEAAAPDLTGAQWKMTTQETGPLPAPEPIVANPEPTEPVTPIITPPVGDDVSPAEPTAPVIPIIGDSNAPIAAPAPTPNQVNATWQEELAKANIKDVLKAAGLDDFAIGALEYYKQTGDLTPYLEVRTVDFSKMSDLDILKYELRAQYKSLSEEDFQLLYEDEVNEKYKLDREIYADDSNAAKTGLIRLKVDADKLRQVNITKQSQFKAPERTVDPAIAQAFQQEQIEIQNYQNNVKTSEVTKSLTQNKKVVLGEGDDVFNYEVADIAPLVDAAINNPAFKALLDEKGNLSRIEDFYATVNYALNRKSVEKGLIEHGKSLGKTEAFLEKANASPTAPTPSPTVTITDPAAALAKSGKLSQYTVNR